ncbi:MAG: response regulator [Chloroflexi bacterium]|nr:response regulator [Chloroflexota bacterium]
MKKVLVAEDEDFVRTLVAATIGDDARYLILEAHDGGEALQIARREKPDLVLLDIMMPVLDGYSVCRQLKADPDTRGITIVMLSALAQEFNRRAALEAGADGYMVKPFSPTDLINKVEETLHL